MQTDLQTQATVAIAERERDVQSHLLTGEAWVAPTGFRGLMRRVAIRVRGLEVQQQLEQTWHANAARRKLQTGRGW
ncbi:MAG: hypothetical protein IT303_02995 [Dehalococcoidia bacterium]|nr:hypothetical protein [Dehalococcoidia bacterium]